MKQTATVNARVLAMLLLALTPGCPSDDPLAPGAVPGPGGSGDAGSTNDARGDGGPSQQPGAGAASGPVDLLFVIDNSLSMSDKQVLLRQAAADALGRFTSPPCVDGEGNQVAAPLPGAACPAGQRRQFEPVTDLHVAVISTSIGDGGSGAACPFEGSRYVADRVDMAHLIGSLPRGAAVGGDPAGFLSWRAGESADSASQTFQNMLGAVGERGCGWEMPLEAWYRFLIDPDPYTSLERVACPGVTTGELNCVRRALSPEGEVLQDEVLLAQRRAFLRPDSRLAIVMLTDENDCSLVIAGQSWVILNIGDARPFFRGSSACDTNPNDACCYSCQLGPPGGCADDPICAANENRLPPEADGQNLRCFQQKRRFGVDLLYPTERYVKALTEPLLCPSRPDLAVEGCAGALVQNPLFAGGRQPSDVFLSGILGVPWQLLEAQQDVPGRPRIEDGFRYKLAGELGPADWRAMVGDSTASPPVPPSSPFMVESALPRAGVEPANPVNGREYDTTTNTTPDDLQYACIFPMPVVRDCSSLDPALQACACFQGQQDQPLCEERPGETVAGPIQHWAKAYPSTRQLEVLQALGEQAVVSSICARNVADASAADYSYRPAIAALVDSMEPSLRAAP